MHYYERHLGDYARDTGHLTLLEHGVYTILLDRYYATEEGIADDQKYRIARARTGEEQAAVDAVLAEFFTLLGNLWVSDRVEEELAAARARIERARENGQKGGRPPKKGQEKTQTKPKPNPEETQPFFLGSENKTQTKAHQAPSNHLSEANASGADAPPADPVWGSGLAFLVRKGIPEKQARSLLGKVKRLCGDIEAGALLVEAEADDITDPAPWLMAAASQRRARAGPEAPMGKTAQALLALDEVGNGGLVAARGGGGVQAAHVLGPGADAGSGGYPADRGRLVGGTGRG